jgi:carbon storage regulator
VLVLSRKPEQSIMFGDTITVTVLAIEGDRVKLGIKAPRDVQVLRDEIHQQLQTANTHAAALLAEGNTENIAAALRRRPLGRR